MPDDLIIIAEAGVNHNGSLERALEMVDVAAAAGADIIKFQTFSADKLVRKDAKMAEYQKTSSEDARTQWDLLKGLELSREEFLAIRDRAAQRGIAFLSTGFDLDELQFLIDELHIPIVKVASGDLTFAPMLVKAGTSALPVILSTGMADLDEIERALGFIAFGRGLTAGVIPAGTVPAAAAVTAAWADPAVRGLLETGVTILHCTTQYPAPLEILNLRAMTTIAERFGLPVGYSDHSLGEIASITSVALGATVIEKHFTLDKGLEGPDHAASLEGAELGAFVSSLRDTRTALGSSIKQCQPEEESNREVVRRSIVATRDIAEGAVITEDDIECRRPAAGRTSFDYYELVGTAATRGYATGDYVG